MVKADLLGDLEISSHVLFEVGIEPLGTVASVPVHGCAGAAHQSCPTALTARCPHTFMRVQCDAQKGVEDRKEPERRESVIGSCDLLLQHPRPCLVIKVPPPDHLHGCMDAWVHGSQSRVEHAACSSTLSSPCRSPCSSLVALIHQCSIPGRWHRQRCWARCWSAEGAGWVGRLQSQLPLQPGPR